MSAGLLLGVSLKTINFSDARSGNFQKNLTNRRGDMLFEAVTLHRRFPYSVLAGFIFLHAGAVHDQTERRESTFLNAHALLRQFTGRLGPGGYDEQCERLYVGLYEADPPAVQLFLAGEPARVLDWDDVRGDLLELLYQRNPDQYTLSGGTLRRI